MKKISALVIAAFLFLACRHSVGQVQQGYTTIVIQFVGEMDRPVFPIVISSSNEEGNWYIRELFEPANQGFGNIYIVNESTLRLLGNDVPSSDAESRNSKTTVPHEPTLKVFLGRGHSYKETILDARSGAQMLSEVAKHIDESQDLGMRIRNLETLLTVSRSK